jgi:hypothetical protein
MIEPTFLELIHIYKIKRFFKRKGTEMGDKGKKDKGKREEQKKGKHTLKEKRKQKKDKTKSVLANGR